VTRNRTSRKLSLLVLLPPALSLCSSPEMKGQGLSSAPALGRIANELRSEFGPIRFHREEQFEDRFLVRGSPGSVLALRPNIYQIQGERFDQSGGLTTERIPNGLPTMYVATSSDGSKVYRLAGFHGAEQEFNRLVSEGPDQKIRTTREAESRGLLCAEIVYGLSPSWWLDGASSAKLKAAEHFFAEGHEDGLLLGEKWWKAARGNRGTVRITTTNSTGVFSVSLPILWAPVEGHSAPGVKLYRVEVSGGGTCLMNAAPSVVLR
jgi:hypothetical protein